MREMEPHGFLAPLKQSLVADCKSYYHCSALSTISHSCYGYKLPRGFFLHSYGSAIGQTEMAEGTPTWKDLPPNRKMDKIGPSLTAVSLLSFKVNQHRDSWAGEPHAKEDRSVHTSRTCASREHASRSPCASTRQCWLKTIMIMINHI